MNNGIKITRSAVTLDGVQEHKFKKGLQSAQLRQVITKVYPTMRVNTKGTGLFSVEDFQIEDGQSFESTRIAWVDVPGNSTLEQVQARLAAAPSPCIFAVMSNQIEDVLVDSQKQAIAAGLTTMDVFENSFRVRDTDGNELPGQPQYKQNFFSPTFVEDTDLRSSATIRVKEHEEVTAAVAETQNAI